MTAPGLVTGPRPTTAPATARQLYDDALLAGGQEPLLLHTDRGTRTLPVRRWCGPADAADRATLDRFSRALPAGARVLDLGCGPGRHGEHLARRGLGVLGVDTSPVAVVLAGARGVAARRLDALGPLPHGDHGWDGVLLLDGNVGLGGDPLLLLCRVRDLLAPAGRVLVELSASPEAGVVRLGDGRRRSAPFRWAGLGAGDELRTAVRCAGLRAVDRWRVGGSGFVVLSPREHPA